MNDYLMSDFNSLSEVATSIDEVVQNEYDTYVYHYSQYARLLSVIIAVDLIDWLWADNHNPYRYLLKSVYSLISEIIALNISLVVSNKYDITTNSLSYANLSRAISFFIINYIINTRNVSYSRYAYQNTNVLESAGGAIMSYAADYLFRRTTKLTNISN